jgi:hypothetical protein
LRAKTLPAFLWSFQMSVEKRRIAQKQARPYGLRGKYRHALL